MKKLFVLTMALSFVLFSCSSNKGNLDDKLIGKWQLVETSEEASPEPCDLEGWFEFKNDGTFETYEACEETTATGKWEANNNENAIVLALDDFPFPMVWNVQSSTNKEMTIEINFLGTATTAKLKKISN